jgi:hypothetical protein
MFIHTYETTKDFLTDKPRKYVAAFESKRENRAEITQWCYKAFGPPGFNHLTFETRWKDSINWGEVYFSRKEDLEWFVLKWS